MYNLKVKDTNIKKTKTKKSMEQMGVHIQVFLSGSDDQIKRLFIIPTEAYS
jgi:hypothetical protein